MPLSPMHTGSLSPLLLPHPPDPRANEKAGREVLSLKAYVFRALRYLFSVERNRKVRCWGEARGCGGLCRWLWWCA